MSRVKVVSARHGLTYLQTRDEDDRTPFKKGFKQRLGIMWNYFCFIEILKHARDTGVRMNLDSKEG